MVNNSEIFASLEATSAHQRVELEVRGPEEATTAFWTWLGHQRGGAGDPGA